MSETEIDSESTGKPAPEGARPKARPEAQQEDHRREEGEPGQESVRWQTEGRSRQQEGGGGRPDEARERRHPSGDLKATGWQAHTVRGFVSILGSREGKRSSRPKTPRVNGHTRSRNSSEQPVVQTSPRPRAKGGVFASMSCGRTSK